MYKLRSFISIFLLLLSLVFVLPKEFYHSFTDHHDTPVDVCAEHIDGLHVEEQHHSCELLKHKFVPEFLLRVESSCLSTPVIYFRYAAALTGTEHSGSFSQLLRGPPVVC